MKIEMKIVDRETYIRFHGTIFAHSKKGVPFEKIIDSIIS